MGPGLRRTAPAALALAVLLGLAAPTSAAPQGDGPQPTATSQAAGAQAGPDGPQPREGSNGEAGSAASNPQAGHDGEADGEVPDSSSEAPAAGTDEAQGGSPSPDAGTDPPGTDTDEPGAQTNAPDEEAGGPEDETNGREDETAGPEDEAADPEDEATGPEGGSETPQEGTGSPDSEDTDASEGDEDTESDEDTEASDDAADMAALALVAGSDTLAAGETLASGAVLVSPAGTWRATMGTDGKLAVVSSDGRVRWSTNGPAGSRLQLTKDGDVRLLAPDGATAWSAKTGGTGAGSRLELQDDSNLVLYGIGGVAIWSSNFGSTGNTRDSVSYYLGTQEAIVSPDGRYLARVQEDGNFVVYRVTGTTESPVWATHRYGADAWLEVQRDGNLVLYSPKRTARWAAHTTGSGAGHRLKMQNDGNLVLYTLGDAPVWASKHGRTGVIRDTVKQGGLLQPKQSLVSPDGHYRATQEADGTLTVRRDGSVTWRGGRAGKNPRTVLQPDGNLVTYTSAGTWASGTHGAGPGMWVTMQNDGNLVLYAPKRIALWSSKFGKVSDTLAAGKTLTAGHALVSTHGRYRAVMQTDGNFVVYGPKESVHFASRTLSANARTVMQTDGNLVTYSGRVWASNTAGTGNGGRAVMHADGTLAVYSSWGQLMWSSTGGRTWAANLPMLAYGTLRPGESAWYRVSGDVRLTRGAQLPNTSMYYSASRSFPYAVDGGAGITGDLLYLAPGTRDAAIARMDAYERYNPALPATNQNYVRVVRTTAHNERTWVYVAGPRQAEYVKRSLPWISSGDWKRR